MEYDIRLFHCSAVPKLDINSDYPEGERHYILLFSRQICGTVHSISMAQKVADNCGRWQHFNFLAVGTMNWCSTTESNDLDIIEGYQKAMEDGGYLLVYANTVI